MSGQEFDKKMPPLCQNQSCRLGCRRLLPTHARNATQTRLPASLSPGPTPSLTPRPYHQQTLPFPDISSFNAVIGTKLPVQTALRKSSFHRMDEESLLLMRLGMRAR